MESLIDASDAPYVDKAFEFDAPQYFDFQTMAPASPSETDIWFDTDGPKGLASPEKPAKAQAGNKAGSSGAVALEPELSVEDAAAIKATEQPPVRGADADGGFGMQAAIPEPKAGQVLVAPSNLVTAWGPHGTATRVAIVPEEGQGDADVARASGKGVDGRHPRILFEHSVHAAAGGSILPIRKRTGFIVGRPKSRSQACAAKRLAGSCGDLMEQNNQAAEFSEGAKGGGDAAVAKMTKGNKKQKIVVPSLQQGEAGAISSSSSSMQTRAQAKRARASATSIRSRQPRCKSRDELEAEEMTSMPKFKARPFNPKLFGSEPKNNDRLSLASTATRRGQNDSEIPAAAPFRARPVDSRILQGPTFVPQVVRHEATAAEAPKFATDSRLRGGQPEQQAPDFVFKATSGRTTRQQKRPPTTNSRRFSSATETKGLASDKTQRSQKIHSIKVMPLPVLTMPEPFNLESEKRHEEAQVLREMLNQQELERQREQMQFKALPLPRSKPFVPTKSDRLLTVPENVELPGERRRLQRAEFDAARAERELKLQEEKAAAEAAQRLKDEQEIKQLRKAQEFKARPMPQYKSGLTDIQLPPPHWTDPVSPHLATEARAAARSKLDAQ